MGFAFRSNYISNEGNVAADRPTERSTTAAQGRQLPLAERRRRSPGGTSDRANDRASDRANPKETKQSHKQTTTIYIIIAIFNYYEKNNDETNIVIVLLYIQTRQIFHFMYTYGILSATANTLLPHSYLGVVPSTYKIQAEEWSLSTTRQTHTTRACL